MKRYIYKGKEISARKVNLMVSGAIVGMVAGAFGLWMLINCLLIIGHVIAF